MAGCFVLTPHKLSMCILLQVYAVPAQLSPPFCPLPASDRHRLALFLLRISKASDGFLEPSLEVLGLQLKEAIGDIGEVVAEQLASRLLGFSSPEDLFTFVSSLQDLLAPAPYTTPDSGNEDEPLLVEKNSHLGLFLRRCMLSFNKLSFEGTCRLLAELESYRRPALSVPNGNTVLKEDLLAETLDDDGDGVTELEEEDENHGRIQNLTPSHGQRVGSASRAFGVPLIPMEGSDELEMQEADSQDLEDFGPRHAGNGAGVRDGGFSFAFGDAANRGEPSTPTDFLRTPAQVGAFLKNQAALITKELGTVSRASELSLVEKLAPDMHRVHYLQHLDSMYTEDYPGAISSLHRYFDYSAGRGSNVNDASVGRFQVGLLGLANMHIHFGHVTQALQALSEAVRIAQQNNDDACLAHTLASLCHLLSDVVVAADAGAVEESGLDVGIGTPLAVQQHLLLLLQRCLKRAVELKLTDLVAFSRLKLAQFDLKHVRKLRHIGSLGSVQQLGTSPLDVCKTLRLSPYLLSDTLVNTAMTVSQTGNLAGFGGAGGSTLFSGRLGSIQESVLKLAGCSHLLRAISWELYGSAPMVRATTLIHAYCYSSVSSADNVSLVYAKLCRQLALYQGYSAALSALDRVAKRVPVHKRSLLRIVKLQFTHERALNRGRIKLAQLACSELSAMASPVPGVDMDLKIDSRFRHSQTLLASGNYSEAANVARELFSLCYKYDVQLRVVDVLLLIADIHKESGTPVTGMPYVLASLTLSQSLNLDLVHATAMVTLAELWLGLGVDHADRALKIVNQCLPLVLGHGDLRLRARTNLCVARCYLSSPRFSVVINAGFVLEPLEQAIESFMILENYRLASEAFYLQATVFDALGRIAERDEAAASFQKCAEELNKESDLSSLNVD